MERHIEHFGLISHVHLGDYKKGGAFKNTWNVIGRSSCLPHSRWAKVWQRRSGRLATALCVCVSHLDDGDSGFESGRQLVKDFCQELLVLQDFPHLHDPNDCSLYTNTRTHTCKIKCSFFLWTVCRPQQVWQRSTPGWGASCPPRCSCESSPAPVSALSSSGRWCSPSASCCSEENQKNIRHHIMSVQTHFCTCTDGFWTAVSLLVSEEKLDDGVGFKIHLIHVGVLILHHLMDRQMANMSETDRQTDNMNMSKRGGRAWMCSVAPSGGGRETDLTFLGNNEFGDLNKLYI